LENIAWDAFWDSPLYWKMRRALRFASPLHAIADSFVEEVLVPTANEGWLAVHLRRGDFSRAHPADVPSLPLAAHLLQLEMQSQEMTKLFVASQYFTPPCLFKACIVVIVVPLSPLQPT
jgi:hypothetical protein